MLIEASMTKEWVWNLVAILSYLLLKSVLLLVRVRSVFVYHLFMVIITSWCLAFYEVPDPVDF